MYFQTQRFDRIVYLLFDGTLGHIEHFANLFV